MKAAVYASETDAGPLSEREGLQRLLRQASERQFEAVIVTRLDRFGTPQEAATVFRLLQSHGVKLFDEVGEVTEDLISELQRMPQSSNEDQ
jgi:DNA invertase Pin-like site-specific DNA recombinase